VLAVLSGLLLVFSFPKFDLYPLSAVALTPLVLVAAWEARARRRILWGSLAGFIFFAGTSTWIYTVMREFGGLGVAPAGGVLSLLCLILSLYWGCFAWLSGYLWQSRRGPGRSRWGPAAVPFLWVALELARAHLFTGYPWLLLGYALTDYPGIARLASWTGVYGLSFLLILLGGLLAVGGISLLRAAWFPVHLARIKILKGQVGFLHELEGALKRP